MKALGALTFACLVALSLADPARRKAMLGRSGADWFVDLSSVFIHFAVAPALQIYVVYSLLHRFAPSLKGCLGSSPALAIFLYLAVDYAWYWNHRLFHSDTVFWKLHETHHAPEVVDVISTSRNPLITHFFRVYLWLAGFFAYLLADPSWFVGAAAAGSIFIFWSHTSFCLPPDSRLERVLSIVFVTPRQHLWHHARGDLRCNFGSVISVWDRIHGTFHVSDSLPPAYGSPDRPSLWKQVVWPF